MLRGAIMVLFSSVSVKYFISRSSLSSKHSMLATFPHLRYMWTAATVDDRWCVCSNKASLDAESRATWPNRLTSIDRH